MLAFSIPWLPMHDASFLSFFPISWHCWCCVERKLSSPSPSLCWLHQTYRPINYHPCMPLLCLLLPILCLSLFWWLEIALPSGFLLQNKTGLSDSQVKMKTCGHHCSLLLGYQIRPKLCGYCCTLLTVYLYARATFWILIFFSLFVHTYWNHSAGSSIHTQWFSTLFHY